MSSSVGSPKKLLNSVKGREIPSRRMIVNDMSQLPYDYSSTPGGTLFSTTPGGTRIIYDRAFLMHLRNSPLAKSPPKNLPTIPGVTSPQTGKENKPIDKSSVNVINTTIVEEKPLPTNPISTAAPGETGDEPQFDMDI
jgi:hypothetical protein